jgi:hypothetical protein
MSGAVEPRVYGAAGIAISASAKTQSTPAMDHDLPTNDRAALCVMTAIDAKGTLADVLF